MAYYGARSWLPFGFVTMLSTLGLLLGVLYFVPRLLKALDEWQSDLEISRKHACALPPELSKRWPLGIDRIKQIWDANADERLLAFLCSIADQYEPRNNLYQFLLIGPRAFHVLHPVNVEALLSTNFKDFGFGCRPAVFAPLLGDGIFTQEGSKWRHSRELLRKQFVRARSQNFQIFREHVDNMLNLLEAQTVVDLQPLLFDLTLDVATAVLFGRSVYSLRANIDQDARNRRFAESFNTAQEGLAKRFRLAPFHFLYSPRSFREACRSVHVFVEEYVRETWSSRGGDVAKESEFWLLEQVAEGSESIEALRDQLLNVLLAGRDTTACCLSWTVRLLVRHPRVLDRVRTEISSVIGEDTDISRSQIRKLTFLGHVVKESLRLYPPVPLNNREAVRTTVLPTGGGTDGTSPMLVRKGEVVVFSQYISSRRRNIYGQDAAEFRPERWETGELADIGWAFFPFNGGPRQCLGEDFALMEVSYTLVRLLQRFPILKLPHGERNEPVGTERQRLTLVLSSADGCRVQLGT